MGKRGGKSRNPEADRAFKDKKKALMEDFSRFGGVPSHSKLDENLGAFSADELTRLERSFEHFRSQLDAAQMILLVERWGVAKRALETAGGEVEEVDL
jgi:hypothetical protein